MLDQLTATGTREQVRAQLARWDGVADIVVIGLPPGLPWPAIEATLRAAAPQPAVPPRPEPVVLALPDGPHDSAPRGRRPRSPSPATSWPTCRPRRTGRTRVRGPLNALFFTVLDGYLDSLLRAHKQARLR